jgi:hypothetical protein
MRYPFRYFNSSPEIIRLTVMMYIRYPLSLRQVEDLQLCQTKSNQPPKFLIAPEGDYRVGQWTGPHSLTRASSALERDRIYLGRPGTNGS